MIKHYLKVGVNCRDVNYNEYVDCKGNRVWKAVWIAIVTATHRNDMFTSFKDSSSINDRICSKRCTKLIIKLKFE